MEGMMGGCENFLGGFADRRDTSYRSRPFPTAEALEAEVTETYDVYGGQRCGVGVGGWLVVVGVFAQG